MLLCQLILLYVSRQTEEGGAVCVQEGGDEGEVVMAMVGHWQGAKWESFHTTFHWRHHLTGEREREREERGREGGRDGGLLWPLPLTQP